MKNKILIRKLLRIEVLMHACVFDNLFLFCIIIILIKTSTYDIYIVVFFFFQNKSTIRIVLLLVYFFEEDIINNMTECLFTSEDHTEKYRNFRPNYPDELYDEILNYYFNGQKTNEEKIPLAIDVGCGSGQATVDLSK